MDLGPYSAYRLPPSIRSAFGVETAQELADQIGLHGDLTPQTARAAEHAYNDYVAGKQETAAAFLRQHTSLSDQAVADLLSKLH